MATVPEGPDLAAWRTAGRPLFRDTFLPLQYMRRGWEAWRKERAWEMRKGEYSPQISPPPLAQQQPLAVGTRLQHFTDLHGHLAPGLQPVTHRGQLFTRHGQHDTARGLGIEYDAFHRLIH